MEGLHESGLSDETIEAIQTNLADLADAELTPKERALLELAETLTVNPAYAPHRVQAALDAGWIADEIADAIFIVSYYNMATRIVGAFDLPPDQFHQFDADAELPMLR